jgi:hypothetical protein
MGSRITVYALRKSEYKSFNLSKMSDDDLEDFFDNAKELLWLDRKATSAMVAKALDLSPDSWGKKVSISKGKSVATAMTKRMRLLVKELSEKKTLTIDDVHNITATGLVIEAFKLTAGNKLYGGYYVQYG